MTGTAQRQETSTDAQFIIADKIRLQGIADYFSTRIAVGNIIYANDIQYLRQRINEALGHYHSFTDYYKYASYGTAYGSDAGYGTGACLDRGAPFGGGGYGIEDGGNGGARTPLSRSVNTNKVVEQEGPLGYNLLQGLTIFSGDINAAVSYVNTLRSHLHTIDDQTAPVAPQALYP
jgi:hypothetical protein